MGFLACVFVCIHSCIHFYSFRFLCGVFCCCFKIIYLFCFVLDSPICFICLCLFICFMYRYFVFSASSVESMLPAHHSQCFSPFQSTHTMTVAISGYYYIYVSVHYKAPGGDLSLWHGVHRLCFTRSTCGQMSSAIYHFHKGSQVSVEIHAEIDTARRSNYFGMYMLWGISKQSVAYRVLLSQSSPLSR